MSTFTEDFQRRLRAVLAKHTGREIPTDVTVEIVADGSSYGDDDSRGMDLEIRIRAVTAEVFAEHIYDEPGAGARLVADLAAVPDEPAPRIVLVRAVQTSLACPSQWRAWDADGTRYYLRYRSGRGTVQRVTSVDLDGDVDAMGDPIAEFTYGDSLDGAISLEDFARLAGIDVRQVTA